MFFVDLTGEYSTRIHHIIMARSYIFFFSKIYITADVLKYLNVFCILNVITRVRKYYYNALLRIQGDSFNAKIK